MRRGLPVELTSFVGRRQELCQRQHPETGNGQLDGQWDAVEASALVAGGASNKDIASTLGVSVRTTEGHVAKVMNKLGIHSREQIAASFAPPTQE